MDKENIVNILKGAILLEKKGKTFYESVAAHTKSEGIKEIFLSMAGEEQEHIKYLSDYYVDFVRTGEINAREMNVSPGDFSSEVITKKIRKEINAASYEATAVSAARLMEEQAIKYYSQKAEEASDAETKKLFAWLANWEKGHLRIMENIEKELQESVWFDNNFWPVI